MNSLNGVLLVAFCLGLVATTDAQLGKEVQRRVNSIRKYWQQFLSPTPPYKTSTTSPSTTTTTTTAFTTARPTPASTITSQTPLDYSSSLEYLSPLSQLIASKSGGICGLRSSEYLPHLPVDTQKARIPRRRRGRIVWGFSQEDEVALQQLMGTAPAPQGSFSWLASLFVLFRSGEALFMCAGTILTPNVVLTAAHCFTNNLSVDSWFVRVGDNFILRPDPEEQTFRVRRIIQHHLFDPLREDGGDGRHDIALVILRPHRDGSLIQYGQDVLPACLPSPDYPLQKLTYTHCEIAGWGMTEYNNTSSYPDSIRAATITVGDVPSSYCDYLYQRDVRETGKFCAGGVVDACQEDSGGPLMCQLPGSDNLYHVVGIVSSGKGCGVYPGLYTEVSRYIDWMTYWIQKESV